MFNRALGLVSRLWERGGYKDEGENRDDGLRDLLVVALDLDPCVTVLVGVCVRGGVCVHMHGFTWSLHLWVYTVGCVRVCILTAREVVREVVLVQLVITRQKNTEDDSIQLRHKHTHTHTPLHETRENVKTLHNRAYIKIYNSIKSCSPHWQSTRIPIDNAVMVQFLLRNKTVVLLSLSVLVFTLEFIILLVLDYFSWLGKKPN